MGCDVHLSAERLVDGRWEEIPCPPETYGWYWERNYDLFAALADVRNGFGFAGVDTGDRIEPIDDPRGLPADCSPTVLEDSQGWGVDGHSHTWFTLRELMHAPVWDSGKVHRGWVTQNEYLQWRTLGSPPSWCGGVSGGGVEHVSNVEMDERVLSGTAGSCYTQIEWQEPLRDSIGTTWFEALAKLAEFTVDDGSDVRVVMWFDN